MAVRVLIRGGGDLASGVAVRLHRSGFQVMVVELAQPLAVRRMVSFAQAVFSGSVQVEEIEGRLIDDPSLVNPTLASGAIPVMVDPDLKYLHQVCPSVLIDGRMMKQPMDTDITRAPMVIGLGPGFVASIHCHAVIETRRGPRLGRVYWQGGADVDTGQPERVGDYTGERVLRSPNEGVIKVRIDIGEMVQAGQTIAEVDGKPVLAPFDGVIRGIVHDGLMVNKGMKVGDIDPRMDRELCFAVSDKALAIGGGVLEAVLSRDEFRRNL